MVKVQKATLTDASVTWLVLDDNYQLIEPVQDFLDYLRNLDRSPNRGFLHIPPKRYIPQ